MQSSDASSRIFLARAWKRIEFARPENVFNQVKRFRYSEINRIVRESFARRFFVFRETQRRLLLRGRGFPLFRILRSEIMKVDAGVYETILRRANSPGQWPDKWFRCDRTVVFALNYREGGGGKREYRSSEFAKGQPKDLAHKRADEVDSRMN